jgi:hypothetical protein
VTDWLKEKELKVKGISLPPPCSCGSTEFYFFETTFITTSVFATCRKCRNNLIWNWDGEIWKELGFKG